MFITTSRKIDSLGKKIGKYFDLYLNFLKYVPRSKTNLRKLFFKSKYFNYNYFLKLVNAEKENYNLEIYNLKEKEYVLEKIYVLKFLEIKHRISRKNLSKANKNIKDLNEILYFIPNKNKDLDQEYILKEIKKDIYSFIYKGKELGFKFQVMEVKEFDK